ncbi:MAG TPA: glycosyltransferase family 2 protein [Gemmatimonadaceae bacterium]|jgi:glycosyltransferase involved in cell wall biosynthesis|nr:glycosyltransferase family 2 protein [Gemmatimonadaceae bacterium]
MAHLSESATAVTPAADSTPAGRVPCSAIIAAKDEAAEIAECIASVDWAAEVIVVENDSSDDTVGVARRAGAVVFSHPFTTIGRQRNAAIARARHEWILVIDADERATPALRDEVAAVVRRAASSDAYRVRRRNFFLGREIRHGGWERDRPIRLFRSRMRYDERPVHEHVVADGPVGELAEPMLHYPYASLGEFFAKLDRYSRWWAEQSYERGRRVGVWTVAVKPPARFLSMYLLRGGFLDGAAGVVVAALAAMSVAAKYARLWERQVRQ